MVKKAKAKKRRPQSEKPPGQGEIERAICDVILEGKFGSQPFGADLRMAEVSKGEFIPVEVVDGNLLEARSEKQLMSAVSSFFYAKGNLLAACPRRVLVQGLKLWLDVAPSGAMGRAIKMDEITPFVWANEQSKKFAWYRLPFNYSTDHDFTQFPLWLELIGRIKHDQGKSAFLHYIGSIFVAESDRQQYLWLYGQGSNGKSTVARMLGRAFGKACNGGLTPPTKERENWFNGGLVGKRVGVFADCNNQTYTSTDHFKRMTGGDDLTVKYCNRDEFIYTPQMKLLFYSNSRPGLSSLRADQRRAIICTFEEAPIDEWKKANPGRDYEDELFKQMGYFCSYARSKYVHDCQNGPIKFEHDEDENYQNPTEEIFEDIFYDCFQIEQNGFIPRKVVLKVLQNECDNRLESFRFRDYILRSFPVKIQTLSRNVCERYGFPHGTKAYVGIKIKPESKYYDIKIMSYSTLEVVSQSGRV